MNPLKIPACPINGYGPTGADWPRHVAKARVKRYRRSVAMRKLQQRREAHDAVRNLV